MNLHYSLIALFTIILTSCSKTSVAEEEGLFDAESTAAYESASEYEPTVELSEEEQGLFNLVNDHRVSKGLNALEFNSAAYPFALEHNEYMISKGILSHDHLDKRAMKISKITNSISMGENLAKGHQSIDDVLAGWLGSIPHKKAIEGNFTYSTISIKRDEEGIPYYTQIFF